ncbi:MAG: gas vesicle structural protein GvpA [Thermoleophilia bacterium]|nr:gas vesicle structural protein GvpA [Thermoleophilia bacterium]
MAVTQRGTSANYLQRAPSPSGLAEVIDLILDKGLVIDAYVRVSLVGIEILTIDARIVIASVDTYLRFAEAVNRLDLQAQQRDLPDMLGDAVESGGRRKASGAIEGAKEKVPGLRGGDREEKEEEEEEGARASDADDES